MSAAQDQFSNVDYNAVYEGGELLPGVIVRGVPWDIEAAQPAVIEFERAGRFGGEVLDVGCGLGDNAIFLASRGHRVTGIDASSIATDQARERAVRAGVGATFETADATVLDGYEGRFDTVLDCAFYHSLDAAGRARYIKALHRATKPGAKLSMLCFADVEGGMPKPMSVSEADLRAALTDAGWTVSALDVTTYWGVAEVMAGFLSAHGLKPKTDAEGHIHVPVWRVLADRAS